MPPYLLLLLSVGLSAGSGDGLMGRGDCLDGQGDFTGVDSRCLAPVANLSPHDRDPPPVPSADNESLRGLSGRMIIERRVIIRIPALPQPDNDGVAGFLPPGSVTVLRIQRAPTCLAARSIRGALFPRGGRSILFSTMSGRFEAVLERGCRAAEFQPGFYLHASDDGALCAGRDLIHARTGASCMISVFRPVGAGRP